MDESSMDEEVSEDSDGEIVIPKKKMKLALTIKKNGTDGILAMGINPTEFQLVSCFFNHFYAHIISLYDLN